MISLILIFFMAACPGLKVLRYAGIERENCLELFVLSEACGFAAVAEVFLCLGMAGIFTPVVLCSVFLGLFLFSAREAAFLLRCVVSSLRSFSYSLSVRWILWSSFILFIGINLLKALLPPHGPTDVLYYHMTLPKLFLAHGALATYPTFFPSFFPGNGEILFSLSLLLGGPVLVNLTHFGFVILTVMALYAYAQKYFRKEYAIVPGILYLTAPVVNSWGTMAYTGGILSFYLLILCMVLMESSKESNRRVVLVWGLLTGMALGIKYQALLLIGVLYFCVAVIKVKQWRKTFPLFSMALGIGFLVSSPWFLRNVMVTGNPVFPILQDLFPSDMIWPGRTWANDTCAAGFIRGAVEKAWENPFSPFSILFCNAFKNDDFQRFIGPLFFCFCPFFLLYRKRPFKWPLIFVIFVFSCVCVYLFRGNVRYSLVLVAFLALAGGAVGQDIACLAGKGERVFFGVIISVSVLLYAVHNYDLMLSHRRILACLDPRLTHSFLRAFERSYEPAVFANHELPEKSRVLFHGFVRYFYFDFEPVNDHLAQSEIVYDHAANGSDILKIMRLHGITHIISEDVIPEQARVHTLVYDEDPRFVEFSGKFLERIFSANGVSIYRIKYLYDERCRGTFESEVPARQEFLRGRRRADK
ncbi:MAG: glycosyltransferase family 39 protein [Deltaproteobacteria bacterium]|nr:glycosyltransferase family 39 protein [Deltaproteobacteria bacterium]